MTNPQSLPEDPKSSQSDKNEPAQNPQLTPLERIAQSLETLAQGGQTTPSQAQNPAKKPASEIPTGAHKDDIVFADGRTVPSKSIRALAEHALTWPDAVLPEARASVAWVVLRSVDEEAIPTLKTNYPFCLDDSAKSVNNFGSPCIKRADHSGQHLDNEDGAWD